jgi:hypothetical protein
MVTLSMWVSMIHLLTTLDGLMTLPLGLVSFLLYGQIIAQLFLQHATSSNANHM